MSDSFNICLDIGGTKVLGAFFNGNKEIVYRLKKRTKEFGDSVENVEDLIISVVNEMMLSTISTSVPRLILVYLWIIIEMMSEPPEVAPERKMTPMATP